MSRLRGCVLASALASALLPGAAAAQVCGDDETVRGCFNRRVTEYEATLRRARGIAVAVSEQKQLQRAAAGPHVADEAARSAIRDFLPRFAGTLLTANPSGDLPAVDVRFNTRPFGSDSAHQRRYRIQAGVTIHQAELFGPLIDSVPASIRTASRERLAKELEGGDDATAFIAMNWESRRMGRSFEAHAREVDRLASQLVRAVRTPNATTGASARFQSITRSISTPDSLDEEKLTSVACAVTTHEYQLSALRMDCLKPSVREAIEGVLPAAVQEQGLLDVAIIQRMRTTGFTRIAQLVNNQPQFNAAVEYRSRVGVVGPNELTGRLRWERGSYNMNGLRDHCAARVPSGSPPADTITLNCLKTYTDSVATPERVARGTRVWFAVEAHYRPDYLVSLPEDSIEFSLGTGFGFGASAGYGRYLGSADEDEDERDRIDLHVSYDHAAGDDLRQSRFLAAAFYTLRISGQASGVVGLTWANKPEFVGAADRRLGANFGLTYKFNREKKKEGGDP